ncbi:unnamed protein product [Lactuca virosa]|uniref:Secreted protein n=1 Tax=Lactuca virosa TaxID=75947 RepID=A0AAU9PP56_9ASTR|nr:unnamed protein product [Lactuca virosa]
MGWKIGSVVVLRVDVRYWLWVVFWGCVVANDGVWPPDGGTSLTIVTQSAGVTGVTTGSSDVIGRIELFCCLEGSPAVSFVILGVNRSVVLCIACHTNG